MAGNTPIAGIPWPELDDEPNIETAVEPLATHLDSRVVPRYATTSERDAAITAPVAGMMCYVATHGHMYYSKDNAWVVETGTLVMQVARTAALSIPAGTLTVVNFDTNTYAPWGGHSTSTNTNRMTPMFPGKYRFEYFVGYTQTTNTQSVKIRKNGADVTPGARVQNLGAGVSSVGGFAIVDMNGTTDWVEVMVFQDAGVAQNTHTSTGMPWAAAYYLGPSY